MGGINILRFGAGGGFNQDDSVMRILDFGNGLTLHKVRAQVTIARSGLILADCLRMDNHWTDPWYIPASNNPGDNWYVKCVKLGGLLSAPEGLALNTMYALTSDRIWYTDNETTPGDYILGWQDIQLRFDFYTSPTGIVVGSRKVTLEREWAQ